MARDPRSAFDRFLGTGLDELLAPGESSDGLPEALALLRRAAEGVPAYGAMLKAAKISVADIHDAAGLRQAAAAQQGQLCAALPAAKRWSRAAIWRRAISSPCRRARPASRPSGRAACVDEFPIAVRFEQVFRDSFARRSSARRWRWCASRWAPGSAACTPTSCLPLPGRQGLSAHDRHARQQERRDPARGEARWRRTSSRPCCFGYPPFLKDVIDAGIAARHRLGASYKVQPGDGRRGVQRGTGATWWLERAGFRTSGSTASPRSMARPMRACWATRRRCRSAIRRFLSEQPEAARRCSARRGCRRWCQYDPTAPLFRERCDGRHAAVHRRQRRAADPLPHRRPGRHRPLSTRCSRSSLAHASSMPRSQLARPGWRGRRRQPFVYVFGRANFTVSFFGANVFPETSAVGARAAGDQRLDHRQVRDGGEGRAGGAAALHRRGRAGRQGGPRSDPHRAGASARSWRRC